MKDLHRLLAAAFLGACAVTAVNSVAQSSDQALALVAGHIDRRFDRIEHGLTALSNEIDEARSNVETKIGNSCGDR